MRKTFLISIMLVIEAGWLPLNASGTPDVLKAPGFSVFPGKYTKDGKSFLYTYEEDDDVINRFNVYGEDMQLVKVIEPVKSPALESKYYVQRRNYAYEYVVPVGDASVWNHVVDIDGTTTGLSIEQVQNYAVSVFGLGEIVTLSDGIQVVAFDFYEQGSYGYEYPRGYYKEVDGEWHRCEQGYYGMNWGPYGEWGEIMEEMDNVQPRIDGICIFPDSGGDDGYYDLTNGIFGDDYHYIMPIYEAKDFESQEEDYGKPGWIYEKSWGTRYERAGFTVYDSSNNEVTSFKVPAGYTSRYSDMWFFQMGDNRYIGLDDVEDSEGEYYLVMYRLDSDNSVSFVTAAPSTKVSPRNPKRGEKVSVTLDAAVGSAGAMVQVVSASGQTMLDTKLPAGQTQLDINTSGFSQGMYVVTVSGNGITKEAAKIIVR